MRLLACGDRALLAEFATQGGVLGALAAWQDAPPGVLELVPAARTVLVRVDPGALGLGHLEHWLTTTPRAEAALDFPGGPELSTQPDSPRRPSAGLGLRPGPTSPR